MKGPGLRIEPNKKNTIVGIACGTGIALFLDMAMYILRMNIYNAGKLRGNLFIIIGKTYKIFGNEEFNQLTDPSFKLQLFSSFKKKNQVLGETLFRTLQAISFKYGFNNFEYYLRLSNNPSHVRWDHDYFKLHMDIDATKVIVYGPLGVERSLKQVLIKAGVKESQFHQI